MVQAHFVFLPEGALDTITSADKGGAIVSEQAEPQQNASATSEQAAEPQQSSSATKEQAEAAAASDNGEGPPTQDQPSSLHEEEEEREDLQPEGVGEKETEAPNESSSLQTDDIDVNDPKLNKAASVIQAGFRTYLSNKASGEQQQAEEIEPAGEKVDDGEVAPVEDSEPIGEGEVEQAPVIAKQEKQQETDENDDLEQSAAPASSEGQENMAQKEGEEIESQALTDGEHQEESTLDQTATEVEPQATEISDELKEEGESGEGAVEAAKDSDKDGESEALVSETVPEKTETEKVDQTEPTESGGEEKEATEVSLCVICVLVGAIAGVVGNS